MDSELDERFKKLDQRLNEIDEQIERLSRQMIIAFALTPIVVALLLLLILR